MIYLLLGSDDFTKKEFFDSLASVERTEVLVFDESANEDDTLKAALNSGLFDSKKLIKAVGFISKNGASDDLISKLGASSNTIVFVENTLDKRKAENKKLLSNKNLQVKEFTVPGGEAFKKWVEARSKALSLKLQGQALNEFLNKMGINQGEFGKELYTLWQADSELHKLKLYIGDKEATKADVENITSENIDEDVFKITNAIGDKNRNLAVKYLTNYLDRIPGADDKSKIISISALLADQFRNILVIQGLNNSGAPDEEIMKSTGFSSGRLFIYKKIIKNFQSAKLLEVLKKLEMLDEELKTTSGPASLQFFMIMESVLR